MAESAEYFNSGLHFELLDRNKDGYLDTAEVTRLGVAMGVSLQEIGAVAAGLDGDGDGKVSREELGAAVHEFFYGDDPEAPGARIFGKLD
ncbi:EF-hand domain-containing protein [Streptomyces sp. NPDC048483]|uniref:EF-hand domain-containing protein n=1 Tax=Streptomyces sp. NPDC048483 TaxID=3154927 RepID=UPI003441B263